MSSPHPHPCGHAGVPFRETHHISGAAVKLAEDRGCSLSDLTVADLQGIHPLFGDDVTQVRPGSRTCMLHGARKAPSAGSVGKGASCLLCPAPVWPHSLVSYAISFCRCGTSTARRRCATRRGGPASGRCWSRCRSCAPTSRTTGSSDGTYGDMGVLAGSGLQHPWPLPAEFHCAWVLACTRRFLVSITNKAGMTAVPHCTCSV